MSLICQFGVAIEFNWKSYMANFTKNVRPLILPEVKNLLLKSNIFPIDQDAKYKTNIKEWLKPVIDLSDFYVYPINGITEGLNYWMGTETRKIIKDEGDYEWVNSTFCKEGEIKYVTVPSSIDGNFRELDVDIPVALDIAYVGTTAITKIPIGKNVEKVFFSLSKPFGLKNIRTGWYFTRKPDVKLHKLHIKSNYYNYFSHQVAETIIDNFTIDYVYGNMKNIQSNVCEHLGLTPSDSVWLATTADEKYNSFSRGPINRLCISEFMKEHESISKFYSGQHSLEPS